MKAISIKKEIERFKRHLEHNKRIVFSAKFGDGKTYFLREAQKQLDDYYFITLYPINYSVAGNDDVFEYIKRDILLQLANDDILDFNEGILDSVGKTIGSWRMLTDVANVLIDAAEISSTKFERVLKFSKAIKANYESKKVLYGDYEKGFKGQKGSIYEEDAFTEIIRAALKLIQGKVMASGKAKKCVLVLEDLDRIDPAHLFRILNVLGSHMDFDPLKNEGDSNKFGFDNIVVVMDYEITRHIFYHFYGTNANYEGYMSKFFSQYPFSYSITKIARDLLYTILFEKCKVPTIDSSIIHCEKTSNKSLSNLIEEASIRDIIRVIDNYQRQIRNELIKSDKFIISSFNSLTMLISIVFLLKPDVNLRRFITSMLESKAVLNIFGPLLLYVKPELLEYYYFRYKGKDWCLSYNIDTKTNRLLDCDFNQVFQVSDNEHYSKNIEVESGIQMAFRLAIDYIKDLSSSSLNEG